jgi:hypothetical protein
MKNGQLVLITEPATWRLDEATRRTGREGVRKAREALAAHSPKADDHELAA